MLIPFTACLIIPYQAYRIRKYFLDNFSLGRSDSKTSIEPGRFYLYYLSFLVLFVLIVVLAILEGIAFPIFTKMKEGAAETEPLQEEAQIQQVDENFVFVNGGSRSKVILIQDSPEPKEAVEAEKGDGKRKNKNKNKQPTEIDEMPPIFGAGAAVAYFLFILIFVAIQQFIFVRTTNYSLANTTLGSCRLYSNMRVREFLWIFLGNLFLILVTSGIYIPWARVRLRKYQLEHMAVFAYGDLQEFMATEEAEQSAIGDAADDYFDFEIGF